MLQSLNYRFCPSGGRKCSRICSYWYFPIFLSISELSNLTVKTHQRLQALRGEEFTPKARPRVGVFRRLLLFYDMIYLQLNPLLPLPNTTLVFNIIYRGLESPTTPRQIQFDQLEDSRPSKSRISLADLSSTIGIETDKADSLMW